MKPINVYWEVQNQDAYIFSGGKIIAALCEDCREASVFHRLLLMRPTGTAGLQAMVSNLGENPALLFSRNIWTFKASCSVHYSINWFKSFGRSQGI